MKKKTKKFAISGIKKVASIILVSSLVFSLVGCGEDSESDAKMTTEDFGTEAEVDGVQEPNQEIDDGALLPETTTEVETTEATTEEETTQPTVDNGSYKYTIYDGVEVSLPFDIEDYIEKRSSGNLCLKVYYMATDCGWTSIDDSDTYFYYDCGDYYIYFRHGDRYEEECVDFPTASEDYHVYQLKSFDYWFSPPSEPDKYYYDTKPYENQLNSSIVVKFMMHFDKNELVYAGTSPNSVLSRDDAILLAYVLSFAKNHPGENPLYYLDFSNSNVEYSASAKVYEYIMP